MTSIDDVMKSIGEVDRAHNAYVGVLKSFIKERGWRYDRTAGGWRRLNELQTHSLPSAYSIEMLEIDMAKEESKQP